MKKTILLTILLSSVGLAQNYPPPVSCAGSNWAANYWQACIVDNSNPIVYNICTNNPRCTQQSQWQNIGSSGAGLVSIAGTLNEIACVTTLGAAICSLTSPVITPGNIETPGTVTSGEGCTGSACISSIQLCDSSCTNPLVLTVPSPNTNLQAELGTTPITVTHGSVTANHLAVFNSSHGDIKDGGTSSAFNAYGMWVLSVPLSTSFTTANFANSTVKSGTYFLSTLENGVTGNGIQLQYEACGTAPWDLWAYVLLSGGWDSNGFNGGINVYDGTKIVRLMIANANNAGAYVQTVTALSGGSATNVATANIGPTSNSAMLAGPWWLHIGNNGTNLTFSYGNDALGMHQIYSSTITSFLSAATYCGFDTNNFNSISSSTTILSWNLIAGGGSLTAQ